MKYILAPGRTAVRPYQMYLTELKFAVNWHHGQCRALIVFFLSTLKQRTVYAVLSQFLSFCYTQVLAVK